MYARHRARTRDHALVSETRPGLVMDCRFQFRWCTLTATLTSPPGATLKVVASPDGGLQGGSAAGGNSRLCDYPPAHVRDKACFLPLKVGRHARSRCQRYVATSLALLHAACTLDGCSGSGSLLPRLALTRECNVTMRSQTTMALVAISHAVACSGVALRHCSASSSSDITH